MMRRPACQSGRASCSGWSSAAVQRPGPLLPIMIRLVSAALLLAAASPAASQPAPTDAPAAAPAAAMPLHVIPFDLYDNRIYLQVGGPGFAGRTFILDTGAQSTHFTAELVAEARMRTAGGVGITGTGTGRVAGRYVAATTLRIGALAIPVGRGISAPAEALFGSVYSASGRRFDGVVGYDLFAAFVVQIDYAARELRLYPRGRAPAAAGEAIPIRLIDRKPYFAAQVSIAGAPAMPVLLHLDTGFGGALGLNQGFVARESLLGRVGPTLVAWNRGVGGVTEARLARLGTLQLGPFAIERPIASLALVRGAGVRAASDGRIGGELLRRFTVTIDYGARTVHLAPNASLGTPFEADMSGITLLAAAEGTPIVANVAEASPAAAAGLRDGDRLIAIDGRPASGMSLEAVRAALREHSAARRLTVLRDGRQIEMTVALRRRL
jgi:hypothetical protein